MTPETRIYCELLKCSHNFSTCLARRRVAEIKTDWDAPGYRTCLACPVGAEIPHQKPNKKRPYQTGTGSQKIITRPAGTKAKYCPGCDRWKNLARFRNDSRYSTGKTTYCQVCEHRMSLEYSRMRKLGKTGGDRHEFQTVERPGAAT